MKKTSIDKPRRKRPGRAGLDSLLRYLLRTHTVPPPSCFAYTALQNALLAFSKTVLSQELRQRRFGVYGRAVSPFAAAATCTLRYLFNEVFDIASQAAVNVFCVVLYRLLPLLHPWAMPLLWRFGQGKDRFHPLPSPTPACVGGYQLSLCAGECGIRACKQPSMMIF